MSKSRLEAFSDGVIAILITIMVLELKVPQATDLVALQPLVPLFVAYIVSFVFVAIYWVNHHHLLQVTTVIDGRVMWANLVFLFWLSLFPFATGWMGESGIAPVPTAIYGVVGILATIAFFVLERALLACTGQEPALVTVIGKYPKTKASVLIYVIAIPVALVAPWVAFGLYVIDAMIWFVPDRRIERLLAP
jgi:uncharacterized membrane protein